MKRVLNVLLLLLFVASGVYAQKKCPWSKATFREKQKTFLTNRADLTPEEATAFFPLYFELQDKKGEINKKAWQLVRDAKGKDSLTDAEYNRFSEELVKAKIETSKLEQDYLHKYQKVLPAKKIYEIQRAELRFHRELLKPKKK